ncbi:Nramp family divalent metal transporter [Methyloferula stellata]|uniref:Nramp family divalent metal transporter n=1 Tax=Methyloferula stellata TaxID=876270 RepID=UPI0003809FD2
MTQGFREDQDPEITDSAIMPPKARLFKILGPGLITGASDDDPSGIATYSQAGAQFGYSLGWTLIYSLPLMIAIQMISARIGRTTGRGLAGILRLYYPNWLLQGAVSLLLIANTINLGADLGAMGDALDLLLPGPVWLYVICFGSLCIAMQVAFSYSRYVSILKWLTISLFSYVATLAVVHVDWRAMAAQSLVPHFIWDEHFLPTVVAVFGTTISPYLFFWQSSEEAEDVQHYPVREKLLSAPEQSKSALDRIGIDTFVGMSFSNTIALAIMTTAGATFYVSGNHDIQSSAQAAKALEPLAGHFAAFIFTLGILGTGLLAVPVLAGSAAYAVGEALKWPVGFGRQVQEAKAFYATVVLATLVGMMINFSGINPIKALFWSAVLNGVVAVPIMVVMMMMAARKDILGRFAINGWLKFLGWLATGLMIVCVTAMFAGFFLPS